MEQWIFVCNKHSRQFGAKKQHPKTEQKEEKKPHFALLKKTSKAFNNEDILALASLYQKLDKTFNLLYLQVKPEETYLSKNRHYKHIGQAIVKAIINMFPSQKIETYPINKEAEIFYEKLNFKKNTDNIYMSFEN